MSRKLQVFVSSTYVDMRAERQAAVEVILQAGHIPAGMELFTAGDEAQWEVIKRWIDESDVFMLILGGRYGSIEPTSGKSDIEREYDYAVERGKRFFAAVQSDDAIESKVKEHGSKVREQDHPKEFRTFRTRVLTKMSGQFGTTDQLKLAAFTSLATFATDTSLPGWVRAAEQTIPKSVFDELERLRAENAVLRERELAGRKPDLSEDAVALPLAAAHDGDGYVQAFGTDVGRQVAVRDRTFNQLGHHRSEVHWVGSTEELESRRLLKPTGTRREAFTVTSNGYKFADTLKAGASPPDESAKPNESAPSRT